MAILASILPGLREIRAPVAAGYLWVLFGWLIVGPTAPDQSQGDLYARLGDVVTAIGPLGQAIAISVLAYLVGSLISAVVMRMIGYSVARRRDASVLWQSYEPSNFDNFRLPKITRLVGMGRFGGTLHQRFTWFPRMGGAIYRLLPERFSTRIIYLYPDRGLQRSIETLVERELGEEQHRLELAITGAQVDSGDTAAVEVRPRGPSRVIAFEVLEENLRKREEFAIPSFDPGQDLFADIPILRTRLAETAEGTGMKIERIYSEAEFRFAVAVPLIGLAILFATTNLLWLSILVGVIALTAQGFTLEREADAQLFDALRARSGSPDLERITPVFARYRSDCHALRVGIENGVWSPP